MSKQLGDNVKRWIGEIASPLVLYVDKNVQDEGKKELEELIEKANRVDELEKGIQEGLIVENTEEGIKNHKTRSSETYNDVINLTIPFYMLYKNIMEGITSIQNDSYHINNSELDVLASLILSGNKYTLSPTKLHERLLFTSGAITKVLKKLEEKEYIIRVDNLHDKRSKLVQITPLGKEICQAALKDVILYEEKCFNTLTPKEKNTLQNLLLKTLKNF